jgi:NADPH2:quinone reductase
MVRAPHDRLGGAGDGQGPEEVPREPRPRAGVVEAVGKNVKNVSVGDRVVYGDIAFGAYATARLHPADRLVRIPAGVSDDQAASAFLKGLTARFLLKEVLELRPGDTVLYHAAAGGVGQVFVQWAKALGLKVIGTVSSDAKAKLARHAGCDHVINYSSEDFVSETLAFTAGKGVAAVFDSVGADTFRGSLAVLRPRGRLVQFGKASGFPEPLDPFELAPRSLYLTWPILPQYTSTAEDLAIAAADLFDAIATGILKVDPSNLYPFSQLIEAHHDLEERRTTGAAVLRVTREFSLSDNEVPALLVAVGYPTEANWPQKPRRPISDVLAFA